MAKPGLLYQANDLLLIFALIIHSLILYFIISWAATESTPHIAISSVLGSAWLLINVFNFIRNRYIPKGRSYVITDKRVLQLQDEKVLQSCILKRKRDIQYDYESNDRGAIKIGETLIEHIINNSRTYLQYEQSKIMIVIYFFFPPYADFVLYNLTNYSEVRDALKQQQSDVVKKKEMTQAKAEEPPKRTTLKELLDID